MRRGGRLHGNVWRGRQISHIDRLPPRHFFLLHDLHSLHFASITHCLTNKNLALLGHPATRARLRQYLWRSHSSTLGARGGERCEETLPLRCLCPPAARPLSLSNYFHRTCEKFIFDFHFTLIFFSLRGKNYFHEFFFVSRRKIFFSSRNRRHRIPPRVLLTRKGASRLNPLRVAQA